VYCLTCISALFLPSAQALGIFAAVVGSIVLVFPQGRVLVAVLCGLMVGSAHFYHHNADMFLNGTPFPADDKNLRLILVEKAGSRRDIPISIIADADTRHAMVVMSMDTVSQLGFKQLSISTQKPLTGE